MLETYSVVGESKVLVKGKSPLCNLQQHLSNTGFEIKMCNLHTFFCLNIENSKSFPDDVQTLFYNYFLDSLCV